MTDAPTLLDLDTEAPQGAVSPVSDLKPKLTAPLPPARFELIRVAVLPEGAFGVLKHQGVPFAVTLEHTYSEDSRLSTKIPTGRWHCTPTWFNRGCYKTFELLVPGHSRLLFHRGNLEVDSDGCILVAEQFGLLQGTPGVLSSSNGFAEFMQLAEGQQFDLEVREA